MREALLPMQSEDGRPLLLLRPVACCLLPLEFRNTLLFLELLGGDPRRLLSRMSLGFPANMLTFDFSKGSRQNKSRPLGYEEHFLVGGAADGGQQWEKEARGRAGGQRIGWA